MEGACHRVTVLASIRCLAFGAAKNSADACTSRFTIAQGGQPDTENRASGKGADRDALARTCRRTFHFHGPGNSFSTGIANQGIPGFIKILMLKAELPATSFQTMLF
jgi:hypothetical protein